MARYPVKSTAPLSDETTTRPRRTGTSSAEEAPGLADEPTSSVPAQREGMLSTRSMVKGMSAQRDAL